MTTTTTRKRRKYRFRDRATAEAAYTEADRNRLYAEWFATAVISGTTREVGSVKDGCAVVTAGYVTLRHSTLVYAITDDGPPHCIRGIWDAGGEDLPDVIAGLMRFDDSHDFGRLLDHARSEAWADLLAIE
jgi:hypothetical protein